MWKKTDQETAEPTYTPNSSVDKLKERATIGASIFVRGDLEGEEDLMVQGRVEGKIDLSKNNVTIGSKGRVKADVYAKIISVEGEVEGNLFGAEKIIIRKSGRVKGNLVAPRVSLEDGSNFKGSIDMDSSGRTRDEDKPRITSPMKSSNDKGKADTPKKVPLGLSADPAPSGGR